MVPLLWNYAHNFVLYDHIFQSNLGPSTPGNITIIAAQSGETQYGLHQGDAYIGTGNSGKALRSRTTPTPPGGRTTRATVRRPQAISSASRSPRCRSRSPAVRSLRSWPTAS
jgi:phospholipase C